MNRVCLIENKVGDLERESERQREREQRANCECKKWHTESKEPESPTSVTQHASHRVFAKTTVHDTNVCVFFFNN